MDSKLTHEDLKTIAELAKKNNICLVVEVTIPRQDETEAIINRPSSIDNKLKYYLNTYNNNLVHKMNAGIQMVQISAMDVEEQLFEFYKGLDPQDVVGVE